MKISEMINNLQEFMSIHGDIECWYAEDDEGNYYHKVYYNPSLRYATVDKEIVTHEDIVEYEYEDGDYEQTCIIN